MMKILRCLFLLLAVSSSFRSLNAQEYHCYFGNIHAHSSYSDGNKDSISSHVMTPAQCFQFAKKSEHFDFLGISEHNHGQAKMHLVNYAKGIAAASAANEDGRFVCMYGMEYGVIKNGGHIIIYGMDKLIGWEPGNYDIFSAKSDYPHLFQLLAANPSVFATLAHPAVTDYGDLLSKSYDAATDKAVVGIAISSGPAFSTAEDYSNASAINYYSYYKRLLALGYQVGPTMDHDNHNTTFGRMSHTRTVVLSTMLVRDSIMAAYHANRFYASEDWNTQVNFTINGKPMGSRLANTAGIHIAVKVKDPDQDDQVKSFKIWYGRPGSDNNATVFRQVNGQQELQIDQPLQANDSWYYFVEITQKDGDRIVTSPIWVSHD